MGPTGDRITEKEVDQIAAVAPTVKLADLSLYVSVEHLSPPVLHRLMFGFSSVKGITLNGLDASQLADEHLRECGRRRISRLCFPFVKARAAPFAFGDEPLLDYLYSPEYEMPERRVVLTAFGASSKFVQKLIQVSAYAAFLRDRLNIALRLQIPFKNIPRFQIFLCIYLEVLVTQIEVRILKITITMKWKIALARIVMGT